MRTTRLVHRRKHKHINVEMDNAPVPGAPGELCGNGDAACGDGGAECTRALRKRERIELEQFVGAAAPRVWDAPAQEVAANGRNVKRQGLCDMPRECRLRGVAVANA